MAVTERAARVVAVALSIIGRLVDSIAAATLTGKADIVDGDTIKVGGIPVRLYGIDAPEKAVSPGLLPVLGVLFALVVGFIAVEVWNTFDKARTAVATEASALRAVVLLARNFPEEQRTRIDALIKRHIEVAVQQEWPAMAHQRATLSPLPTHLIEALHNAFALKPADESQQAAKPEMISSLRTALDARRQRIVISESAVGAVKWVAILFQALCVLVAIAMVHSDNRRACAITLTLFATGVVRCEAQAKIEEALMTSTTPKTFKLHGDQKEQ
jgi:Protein of unknown function (DUF4239)